MSRSPAAPHPSREDFARLDATEMIARARADRPAVLSLRERIAILLTLGRPRTCVPGLVTFALGVEYAGGGFSPAVVFAATFVLIGGLLANIGNAYTDLEEDCRNLPGRVWLVATYGYAELRRAIWMMNAALLAGAAALGPYCLGFMVVALVLTHEYSFPPLRAKNRPLLGLLVFAQTVSFPFFAASAVEPDRPLIWALFSLFGAPMPADLVLPVAQAQRMLAMWLFLTAWFCAKGMYKNVPDYAGDRAAGLRTSATMFPTRLAAAVAAAVATFISYLTLAIPVALDLEQPSLLLALVWLVPVGYSAVQLVRARDSATANNWLRIDMMLSVGFIATVLLLVAPHKSSLVVVGIGALILFGSDRLRIDSRRTVDARR